MSDPLLTVTKTQTFKDPKAALVNAKKLLDKGEISQEDFAKIEKKLIAEDQDGDLKAWLAKTYPREGINTRSDGAMLGGPATRR
jgi:hypothetical protein